MIVYPAIDLKGGRVVRLLQGRADAETVYETDPVVPARQFRAAGADWVHVVDLDGAFTGQQSNREAVEAILGQGLRVELGGGIRGHDAIDFWLGLGVERVVIGTRAATEPDFLRECLERFPSETIAVGIDARDGKVAVKGWVETLDLDAMDFAREVEEIGIRTVIYTDISRDGMLGGPNFAAQETMLRELSIDVIASGGVSCRADVERFRAMALAHDNLNGVITGKALYDGRLALDGLWTQA
jgi:phosphoribosylformimino-5-aminoimidazole carboxamide ribotide isomerase